MAQRNCVYCGKAFDAQRSTAKYCSSSCRANKAAGIPAKVDLSVPDLGIADEFPLVTQTVAELTEAGVLNTALGQVAVGIARMAANSSTTDAARVAALKQLEPSISAALNSKARRDQMDEVTRRRDAKLAAARAAAGQA